MEEPLKEKTLEEIQKSNKGRLMLFNKDHTTGGNVPFGINNKYAFHDKTKAACLVGRIDGVEYYYSYSEESAARIAQHELNTQYFS